MNQHFLFMDWAALTAMSRVVCTGAWPYPIAFLDILKCYSAILGRRGSAVIVAGPSEAVFERLKSNKDQPAPFINFLQSVSGHDRKNAEITQSFPGRYVFFLDSHPSWHQFSQSTDKKTQPTGGTGKRLSILSSQLSELGLRRRREGNHVLRALRCSSCELKLPRAIQASQINPKTI